MRKNKSQAKASFIDYKKLLKFIGQNKPKKVAEWLEKNHQLPGFDLNQDCNYQGKRWSAMAFFVDKLHKGLVGDEMSQIIQKYGPIASSHEHMPFILKDLKNSINDPRANVTIIDEKGENLIHRMINFSDPELLECIPELLRRGVNINRLDNEGFPPFFRALKDNRLPALKYLAEHKANLTHSLGDGHDALSFAANQGQMQICEFLETRMPQHQVKSSYHFAMCVAIGNSEKNTVMRLLGKVDINASSNAFKKTPLMLAINASPEVFSLLLEHKADPFIKANNPDILETAVFQENIAITTRLFDYFQVLESTSAELKNKVSGFLTQSKALYIAARKKTTDMLQLLVEKKMDINLSDEKKLTPLGMAIKEKNLLIVCFLLDHPQFNLERSTQNKDLYLQLLFQNLNIYIGIKLALYFKIPLPPEAHGNILKIGDNDELIKCVYANTELNISEHETTPTVLELFMYFKRYRLIQWLLETRIHELNIETMVKALVVSRLLNDMIITLMMKKFFLQILSPSIIASHVCESLREEKWDIALTFLPELKRFIASPYLQQFALHPGFFTSCAYYIVKQFDKIASKLLEENFNSDLNAIPYLKDYLNLATNNPKEIYRLDDLLKQSSSTLPLTYDRRSAFIPSFTPFKFFTEEKKLSNEEAKVFIAGRFNVFNDRHLPPAIAHEAKKTFQWLDCLSSEELDLFCIEGGPSDCFLLIPPELQLPGSERLLNKSRWRFSPANGIKPIEKPDAPVDVTLRLINTDQAVKLEKIYWTHEITTPSTKNRILCFSITSPKGGVLIMPGYFLKGGLHVAKPNLPTRVELSIHQLTKKKKYGLIKPGIQ